jgi:hypothetical protein
MGSVGDAHDNAMCESFFATLECELLGRRRFTSQAEARMAVFSYIEGWYNPARRHSGISATRRRIGQALALEMEVLVKAESGAKRVVVFDHTLRTPDQDLREAAKIREVVRRVHNDYTEWSAPKRVRDLLPDEADELLARRFAIAQVWRPIRHPVECWPLAIADARSLSPADMVVTERRYEDRIGQTSAITYNPAHRWYWFPHMRPDEALVFKVYDSMKDGRARFTAHTAFDDPTTPPHARPRESIEIRTLAFF